MITEEQLTKLFHWGKQTTFPLRKESITSKYMGYEILICYLKYGTKKTFYPHKLISKSIINIIDKPEIFSLTYIQYPPKLEAKPHTDYNPYGKKFNRIQIPLKIPKGRKSYIEWIDSNERIYFNSNEIYLKNIDAIIRTNIENLEEPIVILRADTSVKHGVIVNLLDELRKIDNLKVGISTKKQ